MIYKAIGIGKASTAIIPGEDIRATVRGDMNNKEVLNTKSTKVLVGLKIVQMKYNIEVWKNRKG